MNIKEVSKKLKLKINVVYLAYKNKETPIKQLELKYDYSYFKIRKDKNFIIITNMNTDSIENYSISLARIDGNLKKII